MFIPKLASEGGSQSLHFYGFWSLLMCAIVKMWWALVISPSLMGWESPFVGKTSQTFDHGKYYNIYIYTYIYKHIILHLEYLIICYLKGLAPTAHRRSPNMIRTSPSIGEEARQPFLSCAELSAQRLALALAVAVEPRRHILFREGAWGLVSGWTWVNMGKYMGNYG